MATAAGQPFTLPPPQFPPVQGGSRFKPSFEFKGETMITYEHKDGGWFPLVMCDSCGERIRQVKDGYVYWNEQGDVAYAHVGDCGWDLNDYDYSEALELFLAHLGHNVGYKGLSPTGTIVFKTVAVEPNSACVNLAEAPGILEHEALAIARSYKEPEPVEPPPPPAP